MITDKTKALIDLICVGDPITIDYPYRTIQRCIGAIREGYVYYDDDFRRCKLENIEFCENCLIKISFENAELTPRNKRVSRHV